MRVALPNRLSLVLPAGLTVAQGRLEIRDEEG